MPAWSNFCLCWMPLDCAESDKVQAGSQDEVEVEKAFIQLFNIWQHQEADSGRLLSRKNRLNSNTASIALCWLLYRADWLGFGLQHCTATSKAGNVAQGTFIIIMMQEVQGVQQELQATSTRITTSTLLQQQQQVMAEGCAQQRNVSHFILWDEKSLFILHDAQWINLQQFFAVVGKNILLKKLKRLLFR